MLIAMLNDVGINAYPAILCARGCDIIDENHPTLKNLSSTIAVIDRGDKFQVFDGSIENATIDILPTNFLVSQARVIKKDNHRPWINLEDKGVERKSHKITGEIDSNGKLTATCVSTQYDKAAERIRTATKIGYDNVAHNKKFQPSQIIDYKVQGIEDIEKPVTEIVNLSSQLYCKDGVINLPQLIMPLIDQEWFKSDKRYSPIEFPNKVDETIEISLSIPEGWEVVDVPAPISLNTSDKTIVMAITPRTTDNTVNVSSQLSINRLVFNKQDYNGIKNLVDRITIQSKEPFIIKKKGN